MTKNVTLQEGLELLPFLAAPLLYGLFPNLTVPFLILALSIWTFAYSLFKEGKNSHSQTVLWFIPLIVLSLFSGKGANSYNWEMGLAASGVLIFAYSHAGKKDWQVFAIVFGAFLCACLSVGAELLFPKSTSNDMALRNPNILATHASVVFPAAVYGFQKCRPRVEKIFFLIVLAVLGAVLIQARSFGAWIALGAAVALLWAKKPSWRCAAIALGILAVALKAYLDPAPFMTRWAWARAAWDIFLTHPLLGSAYEGGFMTLSPYYKDAYQAMEYSLYSHNVYLEILSQWGLLGVIALSLPVIRLSAGFSLRPLWLKAVCLAAGVAGLWDSSLIFLPTLLALSGLLASQESSKFSFNESGSRFAVCALSCCLAAFSFQLFSSRLDLMKAGNWMSVAADRKQAPEEARMALRRSLRWDSNNPAAWSDLGKMEYFRSIYHSPRLAYAVWAEGEARRLDFARKAHDINLKILYSVPGPK